MGGGYGDPSWLRPQGSVVVILVLGNVDVEAMRRQPFGQSTQGGLFRVCVHSGRKVIACTLHTSDTNTHRNTYHEHSSVLVVCVVKGSRTEEHAAATSQQRHGTTMANADFATRHILEYYLKPPYMQHICSGVYISDKDTHRKCAVRSLVVRV